VFNQHAKDKEMQITIHEILNWELILTDREAVWLKQYVQNPKDTGESKEDCAMRVKFLNALSTPRKL